MSNADDLVFHYTDKAGYDGIRAQPDWCFKASQPSAPERPKGAYFTQCAPTEANLRVLCKRLYIPKVKTEYVFPFHGSEGLVQLNEGRGRDQFILYSQDDYVVVEERQLPEGPTAEAEGELPMIGGVDRSFRTKAGNSALDAGVRAIMQYWPQAAFEDAATGSRLAGYAQIPFGSLTQLFVYRDQPTADRWDEEGAVPELINSMIYLILSPEMVTAVVGDPDQGEMPAMLSSIGQYLKQDIFRIAMGRRAA